MYIQSVKFDRSCIQIAERWKDGNEPPPLRSEVALVIRQRATRKATGPDELTAELFKAGGETAVDRMHRICVHGDLGNW